MDTESHFYHSRDEVLHCENEIDCILYLFVGVLFCDRHVFVLDQLVIICKTKVCSY